MTLFSHTDKVDPRAEEPLSLHSQQPLIEKGIAVISGLRKNAVAGMTHQKTQEGNVPEKGGKVEAGRPA